MLSMLALAKEGQGAEGRAEAVERHRISAGCSLTQVLWRGRGSSCAQSSGVQHAGPGRGTHRRTKPGDSHGRRAGLLVPDIPLEETEAVRVMCEKHGLELVLLTTPTTPQVRVRVHAAGNAPQMLAACPARGPFFHVCHVACSLRQSAAPSQVVWMDTCMFDPTKECPARLCIGACRPAWRPSPRPAKASSIWCP